MSHSHKVRGISLTETAISTFLDSIYEYESGGTFISFHSAGFLPSTHMASCPFGIWSDYTGQRLLPSGCDPNSGVT